MWGPRSAGPVGFKEEQHSPGNVQVHVDAVFGRDPQEICLQGKEKELLFPAKQESKAHPSEGGIALQSGELWSLFCLGPSGLSLVHNAGPLLDVLSLLPLPLLCPWPLLVLSKLSFSDLFPPWHCPRAGGPLFGISNCKAAPALTVLLLLCSSWERRPGWLGASQSL